jgi:hypothetical protein
MANFSVAAIYHSCARSNSDCCNQACSTTDGCCQKSKKSELSISFLSFDQSCGTKIYMTGISENAILVEKDTINYQVRYLPYIPPKNISKPAYSIDGLSIQSYLKFNLPVIPSAAKFILNSAFLI